MKQLIRDNCETRKQPRLDNRKTRVSMRGSRQSGYAKGGRVKQPRQDNHETNKVTLETRRREAKSPRQLCQLRKEPKQGNPRDEKEWGAKWPR